MADYTNPFIYGSTLGSSFGSAAFGAQGLLLMKWANQVLRYGRDNLVFAQFMETRTELGKGQGNTIRVPIYSDMSSLGTTALTEGTSIPIGTADKDKVDVVLGEYGRGLAKPQALDYFNNVNNEAEIINDLGWNYQKTWDYLCGGIFGSSVHISYGVGTGSYHFGSEVTATSSAVGTGITEYLVEAIYDKLKASKVPKFPDGLYRWVANAETLRYVKKLAGWSNLQLYNRQGEGLTYEDLGAWGGFRWIETEENQSAHQSVAFGPGVACQAFGLPMQIRYEPNFQGDFGRAQAFAWYLIGGMVAALRDKGTHCIRVFSKGYTDSVVT